MDTISKAKKLQAMHSYKTHQFLSNITFHSFLIALACSLLCSSAFWLPSLCSSMKQFLLSSLPNKSSSFFGPKCLFILVNLIVVFLVGESRLVGLQESSPVAQIYDEYVERSTSLRQGSSSTHQENADPDSKLESNLVEEMVTPDVEDKHVVKEEEEDRGVIDQLANRGENEVDEVQLEDEIKAEENEEDIAEDGEEAADELNRRVEEFIARVNKQRWLESQLLVCCKA